MTRKRSKAQRRTVAALLVLPMILGTVSQTFAAPSQQQVNTAKQRADAAKAKLDQLNQQLGVLVEQYDQARTLLDQARAKLGDAQQRMQDSQAAADAAKTQLDARMREAYTGMGSEVNMLLGSQSFTEFSDRIEFMGALTQNDADLAALYNSARAQAADATATFRALSAERAKQLKAMGDAKAKIQSAVQQQIQLYGQLHQNYTKALAQERAAEQQAAQTTGSTGSTGGGNTPPPPPNSSAADTAIYYAKSVIGSPYVWGAADPSVGFDCSGLVLWAYAHAGVSLPHSSAMMYAMLPHVSRDQLVPGDLLFFYTPVSHVGIYLGGDLQIDASHPGPGGGVAIRAVYWDAFVAGGRIG